LKVNKKTKQLARRSVLSYKAQDEAFRVVENLTVERASTRDLVALIAGLDLADTKVLVLTGENRPEIYRSSRNLSKVTVREARKASTLDLLSAHIVVIEERAIDTLVEQLGEKQEAAA
jgi:large subunit ribosomal protein L4